VIVDVIDSMARFVCAHTSNYTLDASILSRRRKGQFLSPINRGVPLA
jgi:hypothetical protein